MKSLHRGNNPEEKTSDVPVNIGIRVPRPRQLIMASPYSVFVRSSSVYSTSELTSSSRASRPGPRPLHRSRQYTRRIQYRPDFYPYATMHWSKLRMEASQAKE